MRAIFDLLWVKTVSFVKWSSHVPMDVLLIPHSPDAETKSPSLFSANAWLHKSPSDSRAAFRFLTMKLFTPLSNLLLIVCLKQYRKHCGR